MNSIVSAIGSAASQPAGCFVQIIIQVDANNERFSRMIMSVPPSLLEMLPKNPLQMITNGPSLDTLEENFFPSSSGISEFLASVFSGNVHPLVLVVVVVLVLFFISGEEVNLNSLFDLELDANFFQSLLRPQKSSVPVEEKDLDFEVIPPKKVDEFEAIRSKLWKDDVSDLVLKSHSEDGVNGVYFLKNAQSNEVHSVFKPKDEEAFAPENPKDRVGSLDGESPLKSGVFVGDAYKKEVAAYLLDHDNFAGVPETNFASFSIKADSKVGSLQAFVANDGPSEDFSSNKFSVKDVHAIGLLDARIANLDRHAGNMLVKKATGDLNLIPIDHGYSLPDYRKMKDLTFEWSMWKHAAVPFDDETKDYVERIDVMTDARMLKSVLEMRDESVVTYVLCSTFVKEAVRKGWTLKQIGEFMQRDLINDESPSKFEILISKSVEESKFSLGSGDLLSSPEMTSLLECFHQAFAELS